MTGSGFVLETAPYRPVERFWLDRDLVLAGTLAGYAAPAGGLPGCALKLMAGGTLFAATKAWAFSESARAAGIEDGWAGFRIHGLMTAMSLGPPVELRCAVSDAVLVELDRLDLPAQLAIPRKRRLDAQSMRLAAAAAYGCTELEHVRPIAQRFREDRGNFAVVEASYRWLLRRVPADTEVHGLVGNLKPDWTVSDLWSVILNSDEFRAGPGLPLLGPHEPGFAFRAG